MCTRHEFESWNPSKCAYCMKPGSEGRYSYTANGYPLLVCAACDEQIRYRRLVDNYHEFEPVSTVEVYA